MPVHFCSCHERRLWHCRACSRRGGFSFSFFSFVISSDTVVSIARRCWQKRGHNRDVAIDAAESQPGHLAHRVFVFDADAVGAVRAGRNVGRRPFDGAQHGRHLTRNDRTATQHAETLSHCRENPRTTAVKRRQTYKKVKEHDRKEKSPAKHERLLSRSTSVAHRADRNREAAGECSYRIVFLCLSLRFFPIFGRPLFR